MDRKLQIYIALLLLHIKTKTVCPLFHEKSQDWYELGFDVAHGILEKNQDLEIDKPIDDKEAKTQAYALLQELKTIISAEVKTNKEIGKDNLLRGLYDKLDFACGNARAFLSEEKEETKKSPFTK